MSEQVDTPFQPFTPGAAPEPPKRRPGRPRTVKDAGAEAPKKRPRKAADKPKAVAPDVFPVGQLVEICADMAKDEILTFGVLAAPWAKLTPEARGRIVTALDKLFARK
jgi:hypothetical protein